MTCTFVTTCLEKFTIFDLSTKKMLQFFLNMLHDDVHVNPCRITLGSHNIHVNFF
jgi:hypothetical protein